MHTIKKVSILNLEPYGYSLAARSVLERIGHVDDGPLSRDVLLKSIGNYEILIVRLGHIIDAEVMDAAPRLKTIVSATTGLNHIDLAEAEKRGIDVVSLKGETEFLEGIHATAEYTWALLLTLIRKIPQAHANVLAGGWNRDLFKGHELYGRTLGIIGLGRIGTKIARYGLAFGMEVIAYDLRKPSKLPYGIELKSLEETLAMSDVISIHVNYSPENHGMIGKTEISAMKNGALLINTSRGEVIDENALLRGLLSGHLSGAALDVLCGENAAGGKSMGLINYARSSDNLIITPHTGGCTYESMEKTEIFMANKLVNYYQKEDLTD